MLRYKMSWARPTGPYHDVALSSRVRLARNLKDHPFPWRADEDSVRAVREAAFSAVKDTRLKDCARVSLEEIDALDRQFLLERRLISPVLAAEPKGRGVLVGDAEVLSVMANEEDHLRLQGVDSGLCLSELHSEVSALDDELSRRLAMAFHPRWGYLAACPTNTGTGLRASVLLHLPGLALTGQINRVLDGLSQLGIMARGHYGEGSQVLGDFYQISNATTLGLSEADLIDAVTRVVDGLIQKENEARRALASGTQKLRLEDLIYRALGVLTQARTISFEETMQHLSYVRMGLAFQWKLPVNLNSINELIVLAQPAHIQMLAGKELEASDRDFLRATLLRRRLKGEDL